MSSCICDYADCYGIYVDGWNDGLNAQDSISGIVYDTEITGNTVCGNGIQLTVSMVDGVKIRSNTFAGSFIECIKNNSVVKNVIFDGNRYYNENGFYAEFLGLETDDFNIWREHFDNNRSLLSQFERDS